MYQRILISLLFFFAGMPLTPVAALAGAGQGLDKPALVYMLANKTDGAFIDAARNGAARARKDFNIHYKEYRLHNSDHVLNKIDELAAAGFSPIICVGYQSVSPVLQLAEKYPHTKFSVIDGLVPPLFNNVQSVIFKDHEGSFLVGMLAAYASKTNKLGFVGGLDIPLIRNFAHGFKQGAQYVNPKIKLLTDFVGDNSAAWSDVDNAHKIALAQYASDVDIIFTAAGGAGLGVLKAAQDAKQLAIGVDANQNGLYPGYVLTSMVKRVDVAVYKTLKMIQNGKWEHGIRYLGLKDGALDFAIDKYNHTLVTNQSLERVVRAKEHIINGLIDVEMYSPR
jgi:basic membrane protein A